MPRAAADLPFPIDAWLSFQAYPSVARLLKAANELQELVSWPTAEDWQALALKHTAFSELNLRFSLEEKPGQRARRKIAKSTLRSYEQWIFERGEIPTRAQNLHDFFNAIIWINFPASKLALHQSALGIQSSWPVDPDFQKGKRSPLADRLTCFDEGGVMYEMIAGEDRETVEALLQSRDDAAKEQFVRNHQGRFTLFGHGILEVMMKRKIAGEMTVRVNASCVVLDPCTQARDAKLRAYLTDFDRDKPDHGTILVEWLNE